MTYDPIPPQPTSGQNPWYDTMSAWMDGIQTAIGQVDTGWTLHSLDSSLHLPAVDTNGQVLTLVGGAAAWADPTGGTGTSDHGALTGLTDPDHPIGAVTGLQAALDAKAVVGHTHTGFDPTGTAAAAVAAHVAAADPHSVYLTAVEGAAAYSPLASKPPAGGATGQVLTKTGAGDYAFAWATPTGGSGLTAPATLTGSDPNQIVMTIKGAPAQASNIWEVRANDNTAYAVIEGDGEMRVGSGVNTSNGTFRVGVTNPAVQGLLVKLAAAQSAKALQIIDSSNNEVMHVKPDGTVVGANIGGIFKTAVVLDSGAQVPAAAAAVAGTILLRRPA